MLFPPNGRTLLGVPAGFCCPETSRFGSESNFVTNQEWGVLRRSASGTNAATSRGVFVRDDAVAASQMLGKATHCSRAQANSFLIAMQVQTEDYSLGVKGSCSCGSRRGLFV